MASGSVLTLGGSITHGISGERPVGSKSIADPDGHVSQACLLYNVDRSLLLAAGGRGTPGLRESAKDWIPVHRLQGTGTTPKPDVNGHSHSEPATCIVNVLPPGILKWSWLMAFQKQRKDLYCEVEIVIFFFEGSFAALSKFKGC